MSHKLGKRTLLLIRHGQATHNVLINRSKSSEFPVDECLEIRAKGYGVLDPGLTTTGKWQALSLKTHPCLSELDILVTSPLRRALQTAHLGFNCSGIPRLIVHHEARERDGGFGRLCDSGLPKITAQQYATDYSWDWSLVPDYYSKRDIEIKKGL
eukprot:TRINITY_DN5995_c0_g1_i2.p1 TRINITY_DN5995_c0_g1~~TRINITY_DN5995_c0_g1_i2.p1  ORF type:complete len:155 (+),score=12.39 TRINITY_DN5995_c0_g1_i2:59-523(+)